MYRAKRFIFARVPLLEKILAFNRYGRDIWVAQEATQIESGSFVLDVGAGSCPYESLFEHCNYVSQDFGRLDPIQLQDRSGYGKIAIVSDINQLPIVSESFDIVLCTEVIEHIPEPIIAVHEMGRVLKLGGTLLLSAPLQSGLHQEPYHFYGGYTPYWYKKFLSQAGFAEIEIKPVGGLFGSYSTMGLYVTNYLSPMHTTELSLFFRMISAILWLVTLPWFMFIAPFLFYVLDRRLPVDGFTSGYHVKAIKRSAPIAE